MELKNNVNNHLNKGFPFSVIFKNKSFIVADNEYPLGYTAFLTANCDFRFADKKVFEELYRLVESLINKFDRDVLLEYRDKLNEALSFFCKYELFILLGWDKKIGKKDKYFTSEMVDLYEDYNHILTSEPEMLDLERAEKLAYASIDYESLLGYGLYLCATNEAVDYYYSLVFHLTREIMKNNARTKHALASSYKAFLNDEVMKYVHDYTPSTLRSEITSVPIVTNSDGNNILVRKMFFSSLKDYLLTDLFEGLSAGHYIWQCKICDRYFLMKSAHKQIYCSEVNPKYGVPCSYVAKHPEITKEKMPSQKKSDSPYYLLWKKRADSIRKNKSLGKYDEIVSAKAKALIDEYFDRTKYDFEYAKNEYEKDMELKRVYERAMDIST